jgi:hypothetical protein
MILSRKPGRFSLENLHLNTIFSGPPRASTLLMSSSVF